MESVSRWGYPESQVLLPSSRLRFVQTLIAACLALPLFAFTVDGFRAWPFVSYNMYARMNLDHPRAYWIEAVYPDGTVKRLDDGGAFRPYLWQDLSSLLNASFPRENPRVLELAAQLYRRNQGGAAPGGELRLYRAQWNQGLGAEPQAQLLASRPW